MSDNLASAALLWGIKWLVVWIIAIGFIMGLAVGGIVVYLFK